MDALEKLNELRAELGLEAGSHDQAQQASLPVIKKWLASGKSSAQVVVQATQILLADGEVSGPTPKKVVEPLRKLLGTHWGNLYSPQQMLLATQCLILANWDPSLFAGGNYDVVFLMTSPWLCVPSRQISIKKVVAPLLESLRNTPSQDSDPNFSTPPLESKENFNTHMTNLAAHMNANSAPNVFLQQISVLLGSLRTGIESLHKNQAAHSATMENLWKRNTEEILWWGAAKYSATEKKSYRDIGSAERRRCLGAAELAKKSRPAQVEQCASFLMETLMQLGDDPRTERPLKDWLEDFLKEASSDDFRERFPVSAGLSDLVKNCAVGLPVTLLRAEAPSSVAISDIEGKTLIPLDTPLKTYQWSAWMFREFLLDEMFWSKS